MRTIFKVFIEFVTTLLLFLRFGFLALRCEILALWPGIEPTLTALESEVLTTGLPGESWKLCY